MYVVIPTESSFLQIIKLRQNYPDAVNDRKRSTSQSSPRGLFVEIPNAIKSEGVFLPFALEFAFRHLLLGIERVEITVMTDSPNLARDRIISKHPIRRKRITWDFCEAGRHERGQVGRNRPAVRPPVAPNGDSRPCRTQDEQCPLQIVTYVFKCRRDGQGQNPPSEIGLKDAPGLRHKLISVTPRQP